MQTSIIPWHIFLNALAKQRRSKVKVWLGRWRFSNDGVFMAHDALRTMHEFHAPDGSIDSRKEKFIN